MKDRIIEGLAERALEAMSPAELRDLILGILQQMLSRMGTQERLAIMGYVVEHFLDGLTDQERQAAARQLVPQLLSELLKSGNMSVDDLLWSAMGSLGALEKNASQTGARQETDNEHLSQVADSNAVPE